MRRASMRTRSVAAEPSRAGAGRSTGGTRRRSLNLVGTGRLPLPSDIVILPAGIRVVIRGLSGAPRMHSLGGRQDLLEIARPQQHLPLPQVRLKPLDEGTGPVSARPRGGNPYAFGDDEQSPVSARPRAW